MKKKKDEPGQYFLSQGSSKFFDQTGRSCRGKKNIVAKDYPEVSQPTDFPIITEQIEIGNAWK